MKLVLKDNQKAFFISDTHYHHKSIVRGSSTWADKTGCRDFDSLEEHDKALVERINGIVGEDDILFHLGDWSFGGFEMIQELRDKIVCKNIHLILGNHDHHIENNRQNCRRNFLSVNHYLELSLNKEMIIMSHWPMKVWNHAHKGSWHLHGHTHNNLASDDIWLSGVVETDSPRKTMDVGVDTNNLFPYTFEDIKNIMSKRPVKVVDHHDHGTLS
jgi:calcineurin-like phosphoesterase family protein